MTYRLGGNGFSRRRLRAMGSKDLMCSSEGPGICMEDEGSTSSEVSLIPLRVEARRAVCRHSSLCKTRLLAANADMRREAIQDVVSANGMN